MPYPRAKPPPGGKKAPFPGFIPPALATSIGKVPRGDEWIHEVKFDGYRAQIHIANSEIKVFTRNGYDWTPRFKKIANDAYLLNATSAIIDGEVVVPDASGLTDFSSLQKAIRSSRPSDKLVFYAFDLLYLNGYVLRRAPLSDRKAMLAKLIKPSALLFSESFHDDGAKLFKHACQMGLEGIVSKRWDSRYQSDKTSNWIKVTCRQRETLSIVGFSLKESHFDGLYLGRESAGGLVYAGKVDHGFTRETVKDIRERLKPLVQKAQAYSRKINKPNAVCVKPSLLAEVEYRAKPTEGKVRHPSFKGIREDV